MENLSETRRVNYRNGQVAGGSTGAGARDSVCANGIVADGFLTTQFLPIHLPADQPQAYQESTEREFFTACSALAEANAIELIHVSDKPYPYNIALTYWDICRQLERPELSLTVDILELDDYSTTIVTSQRYEMSYALYHIPVLPLYNLLKNPVKQAVSNLLLSVYGYLYQHALIPYYRNRSCAIYELYEMFKDFTQGDKPSFTKAEYASEMQIHSNAKRIGDLMEKKICRPQHLQELASRVADFIPASGFEKKCLAIGKKVLFLMTGFPGCNIMGNMQHEEPDDDEYDEGWVSADCLFSFVYSNKDSLSERVVSFISEDFGNKGNSDQPCVYRAYHKTAEQPAELNYEIMLIGLIGDLCTLLTELQ